MERAQASMNCILGEIETRDRILSCSKFLRHGVGSKSDDEVEVCLLQSRVRNGEELNYDKERVDVLSLKLKRIVNEADRLIDPLIYLTKLRDELKKNLVNG